MLMQQLLMITDMKLSDPYIGFMKAEIYHRCPKLRVIDLAHELPYSDINLSAYYVKSYINFNRPNNIILVAVNNYYATNPRFIVFRKNGNYFIGPDNGIFSLIFEDLDESEIYQIDTSKIAIPGLENIYSHAIACINHNLDIADIGPEVFDIDLKVMFRPVITKDTIRATIIHVDGFENAVTNLTKDAFERARNGRQFQIHYNPREPIMQTVDHYGQVEVGETACIWNSNNHLEIGINQGKASSMLNLRCNETIQIDFHD